MYHHTIYNNILCRKRKKNQNIIFKNFYTRVDKLYSLLCILYSILYSRLLICGLGIRKWLNESDWPKWVLQTTVTWQNVFNGNSITKVCLTVKVFVSPVTKRKWMYWYWSQWKNYRIVYRIDKNSLIENGRTKAFTFSLYVFTVHSMTSIYLWSEFYIWND